MFDAAAAQRLPEVMLRDEPSARPLLVATGFGNPIRAAFSGSSYYLAMAGMREKVIDGLFTVQSSSKPNLRLNAYGIVWKGMQVVRGRKAGGFKFVPGFHDLAWRENLHLIAGASVINNFQIYGRYFRENRKKYGINSYFYLDGTLKEYFTAYGKYDCSNVAPETMAAAIAEERLGFEAADHIMVMSARSRRSLIDDYGIAEDKISIVPPGANVPDELAEAVQASRSRAETKNFTLGFVGLYPARKGLDRLAAAMTILRARGLPVRLRVIGNAPEDIQALDGVDYFGVIKKTSEMERFVDAISGVQLGCQLSRAELVGIALLEFLRFGVPVLATDLGGAPEVVEHGGILVDADIGPEALADGIAELIERPEVYAALAQAANDRIEWASWTRAARGLLAALPPESR